MNFMPPPILSETASTLSEIILIRHLMEMRALLIHQPSLLASHIEGILTTIFRQTVLTRFEQALHHHRQDHLLSEDEICRLWWKENEKLYGEGVEMIPSYRWGWTYIPHFIHLPFYCYSYIFGNLLSVILFQNYLNMGNNFIEKIIDLLRKGSSQPPMEILAGMDLNPREKSFWDPAFRYFEDLIDSLEGF